MKTFLIGALTGLLLGGAITYFMFVDVARSAQFPGQPIQAPDANRPAGTAQIVLRAEFFNEILTTIFRDMHEPAFPIAAGARGDDHESNFKYAAFQEPAPCDGKITILKGGSGVKTALKFDNNHISAPKIYHRLYAEENIHNCFQAAIHNSTVCEHNSWQKEASFANSSTSLIAHGENPLPGSLT